MATDMQRLIVSLEARTAAFEKAMNKANGIANARSRAIEGRFAKMNASIGNSLAGVGKRWIAGLAAGLAAGQIAKLSDAATRIDNALKVAGLSGAELEKVYGRLRDSAIKNAAPLEALTELYGRAALVQKELGISGEELLGFTDKIAVALRVSGKSAAESSGALLQLSQALGSGTVRAEEFNSILEGALPIAQAAAAGLEEAGGSVAKLRQLVVDGKISSEAFFRAFEAGSVILDQKVAGSTLTLSQAMGNLETALIDSAREFNNTTGASENFATWINNAAEAIADFDVSGFLTKIQEAGGALETFLNSVGNADIFKKLNELLGTTDADGNVINLDVEAAETEAAGLEKQVELLQETIAKNTELGFDNTEALAQLDQVIARLAIVKGGIASIPATVPRVSDKAVAGVINGMVPFNPLAPVKTTKPVSSSDFAPPKSTGGGRAGGKPKQSDYEREVEDILKKTEALRAETEAMRGLNPLVDDYGFAVEQAKAKQELLTAAKAAGLEITPQLTASIETLATAYARAGSESEKLAEDQDKVREMAEEFSDFSKDLFGGFIQDIRNGVSATEALQNALSKVADKLLEIALNAIFDGGGLFGGISKLFMSKGGPVKLAGGGRVRGAGGPTSDKVPAMLSNGEHVTRTAMVKKHGALLDAINNDRVPRLAMGGIVGPAAAMASAGSRPSVSEQSITNVNFNPVINAQGADAAGLARVEGSLKDLAKSVPKMVDARIRDKQSRGTRA